MTCIKVQLHHLVIVQILVSFLFSFRVISFMRWELKGKVSSWILMKRAIEEAG